MKKSNKKGFTIVELVIVIAVIAILAAVLIPTFSSITNSAKSSSAQQQARAGLSSVLALSNGSLPSGSLFAVNDDDDAAAEYWFAYKGNQLEAVDLNEGSYPYTFPDASYYAVYVSASIFGTSPAASVTPNPSATDDSAKVFNLIIDVMKNVRTEYTTLSVLTLDAGGYYTATVSGGDATAANLRIYYTTDFEPTLVAFVGEEPAAAVAESSVAESSVAESSEVAEP